MRASELHKCTNAFSRSRYPAMECIPALSPGAVLPGLEHCISTRPPRHAHIGSACTFRRLESPHCFGRSNVVNATQSASLRAAGFPPLPESQSLHYGSTTFKRDTVWGKRNQIRYCLLELSVRARYIALSILHSTLHSVGTYVGRANFQVSESVFT
jgi:hypothetical protein